MNISSFNQFEAVFWWIIGVLIFFSSRLQRTEIRNVAIIASITFLVFGFTDIVESRTGAWWKPLWLLVTKMICVLLMCCSLKKFIQLKSKERKDKK